MKQVFLFNKDWKIKKEEKQFISNTSNYFDCFKNDSKTGVMDGERSEGYYDEFLPTVDLPHDWVMNEMPSPEYGVSQGRRPQGVMWYRKHFRLDKKYDGKRIFIKFDGVAVSSEVYVNNVKITGSRSGYYPIFAEISDFVYFDRNNTISVRTDCTTKEGWWYEGGGIYRNSYIIIKDESSFEENGVFVRTEHIDDEKWRVFIDAEVSKPEKCRVMVKMGDTTKTVDAEMKTKLFFDVVNPKLWDCDSPDLYTVKVSLLKDDEILDEEKILIGFREIRFCADSGFWINGRNKKLKGVCVHHDHGGIGIAVDKNVLKYRLEKIKSMGCNAIRTAHNPQAPEFYEICDELGILVMNEARHFSSTEEGLRELQSFVRRDRNHPSVIMWSLFNEEPLQCTVTGEKIIKRMIDTLKEQDSTRPVTGGMNGPIEQNGTVKYADIVGFNYMMYAYDEFHQMYPQMPVFGSETGSYMSTRDERETQREKSHLCCFSRERGVNLHPWSATPGEVWKYISQRDFVCGGFYWTATDYYGESGPFHWPGNSSTFGMMDVCCFEKDNYLWHKALWNDTPVLEVSGSWNGTEGELLIFVCYSNCHELEFKINGRTFIRKKNDVFCPDFFNIPYTQGELEIVGYIDGKVECTQTLYTYSTPYRLEISQSSNDVCAGENVIFNVILKDEKGQIVKSADEEVKIYLKNGILTGSANGDNANLRKGTDDVQNLFHGCAQFVARPQECGVLEASFSCGELCATAMVDVCENGILQIGAASFRSYAFFHMMSDVCDHYPTEKEMANPLFPWIPTTVHSERSLMMSEKYGYAMLCSTLIIPKDAKGKKTLVIEDVSGNFDVYMADKKIYSTGGYIQDTVKMEVTDEPDNENSTVRIVFILNGEKCGISGYMYMTFEDDGKI